MADKQSSTHSPCVVCLMGSVSGKYCSTGCAQSYRAGFLDGQAAAAPELLDALRECLHKFESMGLGDKTVSAHARATIEACDGS